MVGPRHHARCGRRLSAVAVGIVGLLVSVVPTPLGPAGPSPAAAQADHMVPLPTQVPETGRTPAVGVVGLASSSAPRQGIDVEHLTEFVGSGDAEALHVKLVDGDGDGIELDKGRLVGLDAATNGALGDALKAADARVEPLFKRPKVTLDAEREDREAATGVEQVDLSRWVRVSLGRPDAAPSLLEFLNGLAEVEAALPEPALASASFAQPTPSTPDYVPNQLYLQAAPLGIDAAYAATVAGGNGANTTVADLEYSWTTSHEDLPDARDAEILNGTPVDPVGNPNHGTAVLGVIAAEDNGYGVTGVVPGADLALVNVSNTTGDQLAEAIDLASANLSAGDVLLVEQQLCPPGGLVGTTCVPGWLPVEWWPAYHDAIAAAVADGLIVVEPSGNGARSLDAELTMTDSGAIMVGAGNAAVECTVLGITPPRARLPFSNHGARVDLQSHGACVWSTGAEGGAVDRNAPVDAQYGAFFSGTSAAAAVVAGAAASLSSVSIGAGTPLSPAEIRSLLRATGTPQDISVDPSPIGPQPDLRAAIDTVLAAPAVGPANDDFDDATVIDELPFDASQSTAGATVESGEPVSTCGSTDATVWFSFMAATDVTVELIVDGASATPSVALWQMAPGQRLREVRCAGGAPTPGAVELTDELDAGQNYRVQVGAAAAGTVSLRVRPSAAAEARPACDLNGDGFGDMVIGAPGETIKNKVGSGAVNVLYGRPKGGPDRAPLLHQGSKGVRGKVEAGDHFGASIACGDIDGDGFDDAAVGAPGEARGKRSASGVVHVFFGSPQGVSGARDVLISQATGSVPGKPEKGDRFGAAVAISDVNGDGYGELLVGAPGETLSKRPNAGVVTLVSGSSQGLDPTRAIAIHQNTPGIPGKNESGDRFGAAIAAADTNDDGYDDIYIAAPREKLGGVRELGAVTQLLGSAQGPSAAGAVLLAPTRSAISSAPERRAHFGAALALADLNNDGLLDLAVGAPGSGSGKVDIVGGSAEGFGSKPSVVLEPGLLGSGAAQSSDQFGASLAAGDLDGSGSLTLSVGSPGARRRAGHLHLIDLDRDFGVSNAFRLSQDSAGVPGSAEAGDRFGGAVGVEDIDADGFDDIFVGAPNERVSGRANAGLVVFVPGHASGPDLDGSRSIHQGRPGVGSALERRDRFGSAFS